jgi:hypothetical protein
MSDRCRATRKMRSKHRATPPHRARAPLVTTGRALAGRRRQAAGRQAREPQPKRREMFVLLARRERVVCVRCAGDSPLSRHSLRQVALVSKRRFASTICSTRGALAALFRFVRALVGANAPTSSPSSPTLQRLKHVRCVIPRRQHGERRVVKRGVTARRAARLQAQLLQPRVARRGEADARKRCRLAVSGRVMASSATWPRRGRREWGKT